jgi:SulP family sulfate permease
VPLPLPRSIACLRGYTTRLFARDAVAGITVGLVALPLAMAFAIASGVAPQAGLYTAIVAGLIVSVFGGTRVQIGGPTGAFVVIIAGVVAKFGINGLALVGIMAGIILVVAGLTGFGTAVKYIPRPVIVGFTNGIAIIIATTQIKDFFGLTVAHVPGDVAGRLAVLAEHATTIRWPAFALALATLAIIIAWPRITTRVPGTIVAIFAGTAAVAIFHLPVDTIGSVFGGIPQGLPPLTIPHLQPELIGALIPSACTVAFLAGVESLLSAVVADGMTGERHDSNLEIIAQGLANIVSPLFGGIPATGAIARTATNIRSGATTPVAGIVHALTVLVIVLVAAPLVNFVPLAALAAVLLTVAYHMGEWRQIGRILRLSKADIAVWLTTFALTVFADLTVAVGIGIALAALLYIYRVSETTSVDEITPASLAGSRNHSVYDVAIPDDVSVLQIHGPFLFGTTDALAAATADLARLHATVIVRLRDMPAIDATGLYALEQLAARVHASGRRLLLCGAMKQPLRLLAGSQFLQRVGPENLLPDITSALARAAELRQSAPDV